MYIIGIILLLIYIYLYIIMPDRVINNNQIKVNINFWWFFVFFLINFGGSFLISNSLIKVFWQEESDMRVITAVVICGCFYIATIYFAMKLRKRYRKQLKKSKR